MITKTKWTFAKTYAKTHPHEYIVEEQNKKLFDKICKEIEEKGEDKTWIDGKIYRYLVIDDYKYWRIENILNREEVK